MSRLSERCWGAPWHPTAYGGLWSIVEHGGGRWGTDAVETEEAVLLGELAFAAGHWLDWSDAAGGPVPVPPPTDAASITEAALIVDLAPGRAARPAAGQRVVAIAENQRGELRESDVALSVTTGGGKPGQGYPLALVSHEARDADCGRAPVPSSLASCPSPVRVCVAPPGSNSVGLLVDPATGAGVAEGARTALDPRPDGRRYAACGDGVAAPQATWIGLRLRRAIAGEWA